mmetsp:Transcript_7568/g.18536  ORF Transcript_7568/g.18536 Transcript_7568/m.18536 type:complete len:225 (+) Transcript_7568:80-754(+)
MVDPLEALGTPLEALPLAELAVRDGRQQLIALVLVTAIVAGGFWRLAGRMYEGGVGVSPARFYLGGSGGIPVWLGACSLVASYTSAGMVNGLAETMATEGAIWAIGPIMWPAALAVGGLLLAPQMRARECVTLVDPLQDVAAHALRGGLGRGGFIIHALRGPSRRCDDGRSPVGHLLLRARTRAPVLRELDARGVPHRAECTRRCLWYLGTCGGARTRAGRRVC